MRDTVNNPEWSGLPIITDMYAFLNEAVKTQDIAEVRDTMSTQYDVAVDTGTVDSGSNAIFAKNGYDTCRERVYNVYSGIEGTGEPAYA
jgi:hypothetical protein